VINENGEDVKAKSQYKAGNQKFNLGFLPLGGDEQIFHHD
jgi:hypothetical protein